MKPAAKKAVKKPPPLPSRGPAPKVPMGVTLKGFRAPTAPAAKPAAKSKNSALGRAAGTTIGSTLASFIPIPGAGAIGGLLGGWAGDKLGSILGLGEYHTAGIQQNSLINEGQTPPHMHTTKESTVFTKRESLGQVLASSTAGAFQAQNISLQPGLQASFPWLSGAALLFQEWTPLGIVFEFKSATASFSGAASPSTGMVAMATDYNAFDTAPFASMPQIENEERSVSAKPTESFFHAIECEPRQNVLERMYLRNGPLPANQMPQFYDLGTFCIASQGCPVASQILGELWVTYQIMFSKATIVPLQLETPELFDNFTLTAGIAGDPFQSPVKNVSSNLGGTISAPYNTYAFPPNLNKGDYLVTLKFAGTAAAGGAWIGAYLNCATVGNQDMLGAGNFQSPLTGVTTANSFFEQRVRITGAGATFTLSNAGTLPTANTGSLLVMNWNPAML